MSITIAIDGPAGSGKSTISERLAEHYGFIFIDTGAFYRAITHIVLQSAVPLKDAGEIAETLDMQIEPDPNMGYRLLVDGQDITNYLRTQQVENAVSTVAQQPRVRTALLPLQRKVAQQGDIILAGRDIGTVVLPDADIKLYIDATLEERAQRRLTQMSNVEHKSDYEAVKRDLERRDRADSERSIAPLTQAEDATYILTDGKSIDTVLQEIISIIDNKIKATP